ncbi:hypothetical protein EMCRGX_G024321 [Ephydatia muelleri]
MLRRTASLFVTYCTNARLSLGAEKSITCWKCLKDISLPQGRPLFFCPCDKVVLPPSTQNYFAVMDSPTSYKIDVRKLKDTYRQLQRLLHPDRFAQKSKEEQQYSAEQSALVNRAYSTLQNPYSRGIYLLRLNNVGIDETDNSSENQEMLEEVMELNEELHHGNPSQSRLREIQQLNDRKLNSLVDKTDECFHKGDIAAINWMFKIDCFEDKKN